jgi:hypothetical protein
LQYLFNSYPCRSLLKILAGKQPSVLGNGAPEAKIVGNIYLIRTRAGASRKSCPVNSFLYRATVRLKQKLFAIFI